MLSVPVLTFCSDVYVKCTCSRVTCMLSVSVL